MMIIAEQTTIPLTTNEHQVVFMVSSKVGMMLFKTIESANKYLSNFPPSISGGMFISKQYVFD